MTVERSAARWPRVVSALALVVLAVCGAALLMPGPRPTSLTPRSNWDLATTLPSYRDFPPNWNYQLEGTVRRRAPASSTAPAPAAAPTSAYKAYAPADCGNAPKILDLYKTARFSAMVHVDPNTNDIASATVLSSDEPNLNARFIIWPVPDGPALIADYLDWIGRCGSYSMSTAGPDNQIVDARTVTTTVDARSDDTVTVTKAFDETVADQPPVSTYHVMYYAVRGVLLECATNLNGSDIDLVKRLAAQTLQKLHAL